MFLRFVYFLYSWGVNMTMADIIQRFREENPELDANVIPDSVCTSWLTVGESEVCTKCHLINVQDVEISPVVGQRDYDITKVNSSFLNVDEMPGGGIVAYFGTAYKKLTNTSKGWLDANNSQWRTVADGKPLYYYNYGPNICIYPPPDSTITRITCDMILLSNPFINMNQIPYNEIPYLANFHYALVLYLTWRGKAKVGKDAEAATALSVYNDYIAWMIKTIGRKYGPIEFRPSGLPYIGRQR